jgi:hypothetical protein
MAVQFRIEYDDTYGVTTRIDIADSDFSGAVTTLVAAANPLQINLPEGDDIFTPVQGSGGTIRVLAKDSDNLRQLYTADPQKFTCTIYKGGTDPADVIFYGFINTNFYSEPFDEYDNYEIEIGFNDGLAALDRYDYLNGGTVKYSGTASAWTAIRNAIGMLDITYKDIRVVSDMYYNGYTISNDNILENIDVNYANYYDEEDKPMTAREVIEGILLPLGLICLTQGGSLWIVDPLKLQAASYTVYIYNASTGLFGSSTNVSPNKGIGITVSNWVTGKRLDFKEAYAKVTVDYSGYAPEGLTPNPTWSDKSLHSSDGTWSAGSAGSGDAYEQNTTWGGIQGWTVYSGNSWWKGTRLDSSNPEEFFVEWLDGETDAVRLSSTGIGRVSHVGGQYLILKGYVRLNTEQGKYNVDDAESGKQTWGVMQKVRLKVGTHYWSELTKNWGTSSSTTQVKFRTSERCDNKWAEFTWVVPLSDGTDEVSGDIEIDFYDSQWRLNDKYTASQIDYHSVTYKDLDFAISDSSGAEIDFDNKYECELDNEWSDEYPEVKWIHGDSSDGVASHRGGFLNGGEFVTDFRYGNMTGYEKLPVVFFKKYSSQLQKPRMILTGSLTCSTIYTSGLAKTGNISDSVNLSGKKFILLSGVYNDRDKYIQGTWIEIFEDDITIG